MKKIWIAAVAAFSYEVSKPAPTGGCPQKNVQRPREGGMLFIFTI